jgi:FkbM family methyltransferase
MSANGSGMAVRALRRVLRVLPPRARGPLLAPLLRLGTPSAREAILSGTMPWLRPDARVTLVAGPLAGLRWFPAASVPACAAGTYEPETQRALAQHLQPGDVMFDIGANVGFFTLFASRLVGAAGCVVSFEPLPASVAWLHRHVAENRTENVRVVEAAVSDGSGERRFAPAPSNAMGRLAAEGTLHVSVVTLDDFTVDGLRAPDLLKIDVEGEEVAVLRGATRLLERRRPTLVVATHGIDAYRGTLALLREYHYEVEVLGVSGSDDKSHRGSLVATSASA